MAGNSETNMFDGETTALAPRSVSPAVFWALLLMGVFTLAACVLVPAWSAYEQQAVVAQRADFRVAQLQDAVTREKRSLNALRSDPAAIARLARRELAYRVPGEQVEQVMAAEAFALPVEDSTDPVGRATSSAGHPIEPPAAMAGMLRWLPNYNYQAVFCDRQSRLVLVIMSVSLICLALVLDAKSVRLSYRYQADSM